jgi:hypothetical protein
LCLFYNITIRKNERKFIKFMDMLKHFPHRVEQVHELDLCDSICMDFDKREICDIFPNA